MPDPSSKAANLQRTYLLTVSLHDLHGDSPPIDAPVSLRLIRADGASGSPLFGPQGLLSGNTDTFVIPAVERDPSMISAGMHQFRILPNEYYFVPTAYALAVGGRSYRFVMPAADSNVIELLDGETSSGGVPDTGGSGTDATARRLAQEAAAAAAENKRRLDALGTGGGKADAIGRIDVNPGRIAVASDLDGIYQCIVTLTDAEVSTLAAAGVNYLEVWFGSEAIHVVSPWTPTLVTRVDAVIDTTEETTIGGVNQVLEVRAVYRINQGGNQTFYAEGSGALRIGGFDATAAGDDLQSITVNSLSSFTSALAAQAKSDTPLEIIFALQIVLTSGPNQGTYAVGDVVRVAPRSTSIERRFNAVSSARLDAEAKARQEGDTFTEYSANSSATLASALRTHAGVDSVHGGVIQVTADFTTATRSYTSGQRWYIAPHHTAEGELVLLSESGPGGPVELTTAQQIALLTLIPDPGGIQFTSQTDLVGQVKTLAIRVPNPELLTGDVWIEGETQGQPGLRRTKWATNIATLTIMLQDASADAVANGLIANGDGHVEARLRFFDAAVAGNEIEIIGVNIPLVDLRAPFDPNTIDGVTGGDVTQIDNVRTAGFQGLSVWYGTKAQFDAIVSKDASTIYYYPPA